MAKKRFIDTEIWDKEWFMNLEPKQKCLVIFLFNRCDAAGVIKPNLKLISVHIGENVTQADIDELPEDQFEQLGDKIFIPDFINFQYGRLSEASPAHKPVFAAIEKNGLSNRVFNRVDNNLQEKEKEKEKEKDNKELEQIEMNLPDVAQPEAGDDLSGAEAALDAQEKPKTKKPANDTQIAKRGLESVLNASNSHLLPLWGRWVKYKKDQHKFTFKSEDSLQTAFKEFVELSEGSIEIATKIVDFSIGKGYKGLFAPNKNNNSNASTKQSNRAVGGSMQFD